ncbi:phosphotriesterase-related protein [Helcococcus ovis]|uniref:Phosphotriesterase-related protein n=2 Tax=Helcococcus ovis TaxID=72026 RepID=A0A4R9C4I9_9FIRM|nr:phosphotriesterase-related protein [Helcococcus ovis]TFF66200.1 phosphotriesterase-related protein [Helcococcus ovis]TFF67321.1 phosphotriesterase-related protein [Helcococcus ovis]
MLKDGLTLIHEHITINLSKVKGTDDTNLNCKEETIKELKELYEYGVRNIIDVTNLGMGRNVEYVNEVSKRTGINIVQSTGFYKEPFLPDIVYKYNVEELSKFMINEIDNGIDGTDTKAKVIGEIGTSKDSFEEMEKKIFEAAIIAQKKTGVVISTHTSLGTMAVEQAKLFKERGVNPKKVIIGHQDLSENLNQIKYLISEGFWVAFDTIGKNNYVLDTEKIKFLYDLQENKMIDSIVMSMDITRKSNLKYKGGIGYTYLFTRFIPMMKENGITDEFINKIFYENPRKIFGV